MTLAVLCSGQGGQHAGLLDPFERDVDAALLERMSRAAGFDVPAVAARAAASMFDNPIAQPLIVACQAVAWTALAPRLVARGVAVAGFAGYSIGELSSHACAGSLSWSDAVALARERARLMDAAAGPDDGLLAIRGVPVEGLERWPAMAGAAVAIVNGLDHCVVGGAASRLDALDREVVRRGGTAQRLRVGIAAHTSSLSAAVVPFRAALDQVAWSMPRAPLLSGLDGSTVRDRAMAVDVLSRQVATTIRWSDCMDALRERGVRRCLELGPGGALAKMMRDRHRDVDARTVSDFRSVDAMVDWAARDGA